MRNLLAAAVLPGLLGLGACGGAAAVRTPGEWDALARTAAPGCEVVSVPWPQRGEDVAALAGIGAAVVWQTDWRQPDVVTAPPVRVALRQWLEHGGNVVVFGHAARLVAELGIETQWPEAEVFRWGFDARTALGAARLGLRIVSGEADELGRGLQPAAGQEHLYWLGGGSGLLAPLCSFRRDPQQGSTLARLARELDGKLEVTESAVLARWRVGAGSLLACGLVPDLHNQDPVVAANARALMRGVLQEAMGGKANARLAWLCLPLPPAPVLPAAAPPLARRDLPCAPLLAHWGLELDLQALAQGGEPPAPDVLVRDAVLPAYRAGADLFALQLADGEGRWPMAWRKGDPLQPAPEYLGGAPWPHWGDDGVAAFCREVHARGGLVQASVDAWPVPTGTLSKRLAGLRFLARELGEVRRQPAAAVDGFLLRPAFADGDGYAVQMLQDFAPGAHLLQRGARARIGGATAMLDADDGALPGLPASGLSAQWRNGFPADLFPHGRLDCRERGPGGGGGSSPDWLVTQANDFVRERMGRGAALLWRNFDPEAFGPDTLDYVLGVSLDPLRAAVAMQCTATGQDGVRAALQGLLPAVQPGFGAETALPAASHVLQNNHLRLGGTGGSLWWDPLGLARFTPDAAVVVAPELFRTRLAGGRPDPAQLRPVDLDLRSRGQRGSGGYDDEVRVQVVHGKEPSAALPQQLAFAHAPDWPQRLACELQLPTGSYELELGLRPVQGQGLVEVRLDGELLACAGFQDGRAAVVRTLGLSLARAGARLLQLECCSGGAVALDALRLRRVHDLAAEARLQLRAGHVASLGERSCSTYHAESAEVLLLADQPGFLWRTLCERATSGLRAERSFGLRGRWRLVDGVAGARAEALREPFRLRSDDAAQPDLLVVPLQLSRYEHFELRQGQLTLSGLLESRARAKVGFLLLRHDEEMPLAAATTLFAALDTPATLDCSNGAEAVLPNELPVAWSRLLRVLQGSRLPYLVQENGWWLWRGAQPDPDGGDFLRVVQLPGDTVRVVGGPAVLQRTRPGPGSARTVALRDVADQACVARVLQPGLQPPAVTFAKPFDSVTVDGRPWAWFEGDTVYLPSVPGTYRVVTKALGVATPHLVRTGARIDQCAFDPARRELRFVARAADDRAAAVPYTAWLAGPEPIALEGAERVPEAELCHPSPEAAAAALQQGIVVRFRPGLVKVRYVR